MIGRNDLCSCQSGKKYKKCCGKNLDANVMYANQYEMEKILRNFYVKYPIRADFQQLLAEWKTMLQPHYTTDLIRVIALNDYLFIRNSDVWSRYITHMQKQAVRPATQALLKKWTSPELFIGTIVATDDEFCHVAHIHTNQMIAIRLTNRHICNIGETIFACLLPDYSHEASHYIVASTLAILPKQYSSLLKKFQNYHEIKQHYAGFWLDIATQNEASSHKMEEKGVEQTSPTSDFDLSILMQTQAFLENSKRDTHALIKMLERYLMEQQPSARKPVAIVAGAIRFGQQQALFEPLSMTVKELAAHFGVSTASVNKYYQEMVTYTEHKRELVMS